MAQYWDKLTKEQQKIIKEQVRKQIIDKAEESFNEWFVDSSKIKPVKEENAIL